MLKKFLAATSAVALALGMIALTSLAGPASSASASTKQDSTATQDSTPQQTDPAYVIVAWKMPSWSGNDATWPQTFFAKAYSNSKDLNALDSQLTTCGTSYQVDVYNNSDVTTSLIAGGHLDRPGDPAEDFPLPESLGVTFKLVHNADCLPQDASASVNVSSPSCTAPGTATFNLVNASWSATTPEDQTVGDHTRTAIAASGHTFAGGATTLEVHYTVPGVLDAHAPSCYNPAPVKPSYSSNTQCGVYGSISLVDTAYITYAITAGDGKQGINVVTATAVSPYTLDPAAASSWVIDLGSYSDCYRPAVSWTLAGCTVSGPDTSIKELSITFDNTASTAAITFTVPSASITKIVAAGASETVTVPIGTSGSSGLKVYADGELLDQTDPVAAFDGCLPATVKADPAVAATCSPSGAVLDGSVIVDYQPGTVKYTITGGPGSVHIVANSSATTLPPGTYTVTPTAMPGYVLDPSTPASWEETIADPSPCSTPGCTDGQLSSSDSLDGCQPPTLAAWPTAVTVTNPTCSAQNGTLTVGELDGVSFFAEVDYFLNDSSTPMSSQTVSLPAGNYTVTASPHTAGDGLTGPASFKVTIAAATVLCADLKTLALTGSSPTGGVVLGYLLLASGLAIVAMRLTRRRGRLG
ncbi:hypothetical protein ACFPJ4_08690 [Lysinimonas soli]|uniref:Prealbumin-like fold domain-containing protein n=1 Tax=Lysinimonas soli TaxID=1074233 RepID=A0ABW0NST6_9MICO